MKEQPLFLYLLCLVFCLTSNCKAPADTDKPNILFISIDDLRPALVTIR